MWTLLGSAVSAIGGTVASLYENNQANNAIQGGIQSVEKDRFPNCRRCREHGG